MKIFVLGCSGPKLAHAAPARDLYTSDLFRKCRALAERDGDAWLILSALHGFVRPDQVLQPYDVTIPTRRAAAAQWRRMCSAQAPQLLRGASRVVFLAGEKYGAAWLDTVPSVEYPLRGLGIGERLAWLKRELA